MPNRMKNHHESREVTLPEVKTPPFGKGRRRRLEPDYGAGRSGGILELFLHMSEEWEMNAKEVYENICGFPRTREGLEGINGLTTCPR